MDAADTTLPEKSARGSAVLAGITRAMPLILGNIPVSFAFGVVALGAGVSPFNTIFMSALVYAGSSQLVAVGLLVEGATILSVVAATFMVNLRHFLMSSALAPYLRRYRKSHVAAFAFQLTDEAFAVHSAEFANRNPSRTEIFAINLALYFSWLAGTLAAVLTGASPAQMNRFGLDFAPPAMFIGLLVLLVKDRLQMLITLLCGGLAVFLTQHGVGAWSIIIATVLGASLGTLGQLWINRRFSSPSLG